jgi:hypothetical protein
MLSYHGAIHVINRLGESDRLIAQTTADGFVFITQYTRKCALNVAAFLNLAHAKDLICRLITAFPHINSISDLYRKAPVLDRQLGASLFYPLALACVYWMMHGVTQLKKWSSLTFARYLGGDLTLIEEITRNHDLSMGSETVCTTTSVSREASGGEKRKFMVHHAAAAHTQALTAVLAPDVAASSTVTNDNGVVFAQMFASFETRMQEQRDLMQQELQKKQEQQDAQEKKQEQQDAQEKQRAKKRRKQDRHRIKVQQDERREAGDCRNN